MLRKILSIAISTVMIPGTLSAATGPSSSQSPYLVPNTAGVEFTSILTTGDGIKKKHKGDGYYRMAGIPDGLGAYDNGDGTITVLMNHEFNINGTTGVPTGIVRDHGGAGAFVSKWKIRKSDLTVLNGEDLIKKVMLWDPVNLGYVESLNNVFIRFCSADLASPSAFYNRKSGKGFDEGRIFLNGEEEKTSLRPSQRAFAHIAEGRQQGTSYELPLMGHANWENLLASPYPQDKTLVVGQDDGGFNKVFFYIGEKQETGNPVELAGLANGITYALSIDGFATEASVGGSIPIPIAYSGRFSLTANTAGTVLQRPEDGAWDTVNPNRYYFVTTASMNSDATGDSRLWRLTFDDITRPELGGTVEVMIDGNAIPSPQIKMMDNITLDKEGSLYMLEDVGNNIRLGQIWSYNPSTNTVTNLGQHDPSRFLSGGSNFLTQDEESSGIIDVTRLFRGVRGYDTKHYRYFLLDVQAHFLINAANPRGFTNPEELVEGGQLLMMTVPKATVLDGDSQEDEYYDEVEK
ncbi:MAG: hypothetical protein HY200_10775 [Nitrospirae bacterium]|nr:hypothetical protein [Nitrospirota bacterium]